MIDSLIQFELAYINTNHPDFIDVGTVLGATFSEPMPAAHAPRLQQTPVPEPVKPPAQQAPGPASEPPMSPLNWFGGKDTKGRTGAAQAGPAAQQKPQQKVRAPAHGAVRDTARAHGLVVVLTFLLWVRR